MPCRSPSPRSWRFWLVCYQLRCRQLNIFSFLRNLMHPSHRSLCVFATYANICHLTLLLHHFLATRIHASSDLVGLSTIGTVSMNGLNAKWNCKHVTSLARHEMERKRYTHNKSSHDSSPQAPIRVHYIYHSLHETTILLTCVSVVALLQQRNLRLESFFFLYFDTKLRFFRNWKLFYELISASHFYFTELSSRLPNFPFLLIELSNRRSDYGKFLIRERIDH